MSVRTVLEITCDECGVLQRFEIASNHGQSLVATTGPAEMFERHGWREQPIEGAGRFRQQDICRNCFEAKQK